MLNCMKRPKTEKEKMEAEDLQYAGYENSLEYFLLWHGR